MKRVPFNPKSLKEAIRRKLLYLDAYICVELNDIIVYCQYKGLGPQYIEVHVESKKTEKIHYPYPTCPLPAFVYVFEPNDIARKLGISDWEMACVKESLAAKSLQKTMSRLDPSQIVETLKTTGHNHVQKMKELNIDELTYIKLNAEGVRAAEKAGIIQPKTSFMLIEKGEDARYAQYLNLVDHENEQGIFVLPKTAKISRIFIRYPDSTCRPARIRVIKFLEIVDRLQYQYREKQKAIKAATSLCKNHPKEVIKTLIATHK